MTPGRAAAIVVRWVRLYTTGLPAPAAHRRLEEIDADLHDQIDEERSIAVPEDRIARHIISRMLRGAFSDVAWRGRELQPARARIPGETTTTSSLARPALRVTVFVFAVLAIPLVGMAVSEEVDWAVGDFVLAGILLTAIGATFEAAVQRRGSVVIGGSVAVLGIVAAVLGRLDDAPGLVLLGGLLAAAGGAVAYRRAHDLS